MRFVGRRAAGALRAFPAPGMTRTGVGLTPSLHVYDAVMTRAAEDTRRVAQTVLEVVFDRGAITVPELAEELGPVDVDIDLLATFRDALDDVIACKRELPEGSTGELEESPWGPSPSADRLAGALAEEERARRRALDAVLSSALTRDDVAGRLGISPQAVSERLKARTLTAVRRGRGWRFPSWQFSDDATLPGLRALIAAWPGSPLALSTWAVAPHPDLEGRTPAQELARPEGVAAVLELVQAVRAAGW
jgi:hypothetical protein